MGRCGQSYLLEKAYCISDQWKLVDNLINRCLTFLHGFWMNRSNGRDENDWKSMVNFFMVLVPNYNWYNKQMRILHLFAIAEFFLLVVIYFNLFFKWKLTHGYAILEWNIVHLLLSLNKYLHSDVMILVYLVKVTLNTRVMFGSFCPVVFWHVDIILLFFGCRAKHKEAGQGWFYH